ncbi:glycoside hydrolase family 18 protein [Wolfiporia cocos MD-104 SS10]|uniref:Glycoside hydrolase family 18 protein n=1 Tax=Wolfiporia cocos (strain MD-104) TaxID=742152 RepID=A0A2H3K0Z2_WOLCO|nr:glycoside hydrolase family 18 protein [Wolfiporia cocos MD-104 SS10]
MSWYAGWHGTGSTPDFTPENISWSKYTAVSYTFATTTPDVGTISLAASDEQLLPQFVELAHQNNVKAIVTIGGWTGSQYFSSAVATAANRSAFVQTALDLVSKYNLDGLDFDWEYPNKQGLGCNIISPSDSANFLSFLQALRAAPGGRNLTLSAAAGIAPFAGAGGTPMSNVSAFAAVLDYVEVMNYDVWGSWSSAVGPNAPLADACAPGADQQGSAESAVRAWTAAGFPAGQLVLGVAAYGHSFLVEHADAYAAGGAGASALAAYPPFVKGAQPMGDSWDANATAGLDQCGVYSAGGPTGIFDFWGLVEDGFLTDAGDVADGIAYRYDNCSQTPYVYKPSTQVMVSFDNAESLRAKGAYIKDTGLRGFAMWETGGDYEDILLDAISGAAGLEQKSAIVVQYGGRRRSSSLSSRLFSWMRRWMWR